MEAYAHKPSKKFQSSLPVAGERVLVIFAASVRHSLFQSSLPVAGERVRRVTPHTVSLIQFQSSLPVAGERVAHGPTYSSRVITVSILAPRCRGARPGDLQRRDHRHGVSILAPRCRGARRTAGRISSAGEPVSILAPRCRGARRKRISRSFTRLVVSILAPRCRGARPPRIVRRHTPRWGFNPRSPLPGSASLRPASETSQMLSFQSSLPVAGERVHEPGCHATRPAFVSILAPRCRGARRDVCSFVFLRRYVSILAPRCRGARPGRQSVRCCHRRVSILAPRCRGARLLPVRYYRRTRDGFNPRSPLPGSASAAA